MEKKTTIYTALASMLALSSCVQEGPAGGAVSEEASRIHFRSYLPTVTETRAGVITKENLSECRVTAINSDDTITTATGLLEPYFRDLLFERHADGHLLAEDAKATLWPNSTCRLHFFAYWPSCESMKETSGKGLFNLVNYSTKPEGTALLDYRLEDFKVAHDIADQVDFIAAYATSTQKETGNNPIDISFRHCLARVELSAWSGSEKYDFEIVGMRIGNALTDGHFNFTSLMPGSDPAAAWTIKEGKCTPVEHIFGEGEDVVVLSYNKGIHSSAGDVVSIMGNAGPAMVIPMPEKIEAWEGLADPNIKDEKYSTDRLYLSVLLRVINEAGEVVYPYPNNCDFIPEYNFAVGADGKVIRQLYKKGEEYYTSTEENAPKYVGSDDEEIRSFSWAALPVTGGAKWAAGKVYTYKLNYTNGIGWQDPEDPTPGEPIIERGLVPFEVNVAEWVEAEGHDPNLEVPKR